MLPKVLPASLSSPYQTGQWSEPSTSGQMSQPVTQIGVLLAAPLLPSMPLPGRQGGSSVHPSRPCSWMEPGGRPTLRPETRKRSSLHSGNAGAQEGGGRGHAGRGHAGRLGQRAKCIGRAAECAEWGCLQREGG